VPVLVVALSAVACSLPALRAMRVDAVTALRYE
jgi:ABC-type lipoprotein release transport system permease subunit